MTPHPYRSRNDQTKASSLTEFDSPGETTVFSYSRSGASACQYWARARKDAIAIIPSLSFFHGNNGNTAFNRPVSQYSLGLQRSRSVWEQVEWILGTNWLKSMQHRRYSPFPCLIRSFGNSMDASLRKLN